MSPEIPVANIFAVQGIKDKITYQVGNLNNTNLFISVNHQKQIPLSPIQSKFFMLLIDEPNKFISRSQIIKDIWKDESEKTYLYLYQLAKALRGKINRELGLTKINTGYVNHIITLGYVFAPLDLLRK